MTMEKKQQNRSNLNAKNDDQLYQLGFRLGQKKKPVRQLKTLNKREISRSWSGQATVRYVQNERTTEKIRLTD